MQIQLDDIAGGEALLGQVGEEEFVDDARARQADGFLLFLLLPVLVSRVRCHNDTATHPLRSHRDGLTVVEAAHRLTFRTLVHLIGGQGPAVPEPAGGRAHCTLCHG